MKKALSLALALVMCLGLTVPALAAEPIVYENEGVYQVTNVTYIQEDYDGFGMGLPLGCPSPAELILLRSARVAMTKLVWDESGENYEEFDVPGVPYEEYPAGTVFKLEEPGDYAVNINWDEDLSTAYTFVLIMITDQDDSNQPENPTDTPAYQLSNWAKDRVALAVETNLAADSLGNDYRVDITRAQFAATAVKLYEAMSGEKVAPASGVDNPFTDTDDNAVLQAEALGFVSGVGNGKFDPDALVTREQACVMLSSVFTKLGGEIPAVDATTFADNADVAGWARNAVAFMNGKDIVTGIGDNNFGPKGNASIEQALLIALKMYENLK